MGRGQEHHPCSPWAKLSLVCMGAGCAFFIVFTFYRIIRYLCSPSSHGSLSSDSGSGMLEGGGLSTDAIQSLPSVQWSEKMKGEANGSSDCAICLGVFEKGESLRLLPNCSHFYHVHCVDAWLSSRSTCPLCRMEVVCGVKDAHTSVSMIAPLETQTREESYDLHLQVLDPLRNGEIRC